VSERAEITRASLRTPQAAAIAGVVFAFLLGGALVLLRVAVPADPAEAPAWLEEPWRRTSVVVALNLVPFADLAFLWFIGVVRDRIGAEEDKFFATVFLGTGLLFVAMLFVAAAVAGALIATEAWRRPTELSTEMWRLGRSTSHQVLNIYAMRMAGAFTISTTAIGVRLRIMPRWLAIVSAVVALVLLLTVERFAWVQLLFPLWVLVLSLYLLTHQDTVRDSG